MLYGVRRDLQHQLVREGYGLRVYIPFGSEWYPYFMRRLAERPANVLFIAEDLFRRSAGSGFHEIASHKARSRFGTICKRAMARWELLGIGRHPQRFAGKF